MDQTQSKYNDTEAHRKKLDHMLKIYVTKAEKIKLVRLADLVGISLSAFGRAVLLEYKFEKDLVDLRKIRYELNKIGVNVNQLARVANQEGKLPTRRQLEELTREIVSLVEQI